MKQLPSIRCLDDLDNAPGFFSSPEILDHLQIVEYLIGSHHLANFQTNPFASNFISQLQRHHLTLEMCHIRVACDACLVNWPGVEVAGGNYDIGVRAPDHLPELPGLLHSVPLVVVAVLLLKPWPLLTQTQNLSFHFL